LLGQTAKNAATTEGTTVFTGDMNVPTPVCAAMGPLTNSTAKLNSTGEARVFVVVAVQTEQLPIAAIRWVVVVIVITVVNGQLTQIGACEHSSAAATDPRVDLQRSLTIALSPLVSGASRVGHDSIQLARVFRFHPVILPATMDQWSPLWGGYGKRMP
jgi:hypothetical protein